MRVHVLLRSDSYDRADVLGVYATEDAAKRAAEAAEPDRTFTWTTDLGQPYASSSSLHGPIYAYTVEPHEVQS